MGIAFRRCVQLEKFCGTISANGNSDIYNDHCLYYGYFSMQKYQHTLRIIILGYLNLLDGCRKCVRRDGRWLENDIISKFSKRYIWCCESRVTTKKMLGTYLALDTFHPSGRTAKRHPAYCGPQEDCLHKDHIA